MCYTIPLACAVTTSFIWKMKKTLKLWWLSLLLYGGSLYIRGQKTLPFRARMKNGRSVFRSKRPRALARGASFGIIDHLWNRELFFVSSNWIKDLCLGGVITAGLILMWIIILALAKKSPALTLYLRAE